MTTKFAKQINGIGHFAQIDFHINTSKEINHSINDKCNWENLKASHKEFVPDQHCLRFKEAVLAGMNYALSRIQMKQSLIIDLLDIRISNTDSTIASMFVVGINSIFEGLKINQSKYDEDLIKLFIAKYYKERETSFFSKLELSPYLYSK